MGIKIDLAALAVGGFVALGMATNVIAADPLKVGFIYVGPTGDHGWTYQHDQARLKLEKALPGKITTTYVESVPEGADAQRVIDKLAKSGHGLIFTTSFGYMNPTLKVAKKHKKVIFEQLGVWMCADKQEIKNIIIDEAYYGEKWSFYKFGCCGRHWKTVLCRKKRKTD